MARTRYIKPDFFDSEKVAALSLAARLLFVGLWTLADRDGRFELSPRRIRARLFPYDDGIDVVALLNELIGRKMLQPYSGPDGTALGFLPGFPKHQRPHPNEAKSVLPAAPDEPVFAPLVTNVTSPNDACVQPSASTLTGTLTSNGNGKGDGDSAPRVLTPIRHPSPLAWDRVHGRHVAGFCSWVCLPQSIFDEFVNRVIGAGASEPDAVKQVRAWAEGVRQSWAGRIPGDDIFAFWRNEWAATHGSNKPAATAGIDPLAGVREALRHV